VFPVNAAYRDGALLATSPVRKEEVEHFSR
jgi:hypothetical protein